MKLVHTDIECQMILSDQKCFEWIIESPELFTSYVSEINKQIRGGEGRFVLSDNGEELELFRHAEIITDPLCVDLNDRKIQKRLYTELAELARSEELFFVTQDMEAVLHRYFLQLEYVSGYAIETALEIDLPAIFKAMGIQLENRADNFFENLLQYVKITVELMRKKIFVLINIGSYLSEFQVKQLLELAVYNEITLLFIENMRRGFSEEGMYCIIDKDGCEIY